MVALFFLFLVALVAVIYFRIDRSRSFVTTNNNSVKKDKEMFNPIFYITPIQVFGKQYNASSLRRKNNRNKKKIDKAYQR